MKKTTQELLEMMKSSKSYDEYLSNNRDELAQVLMKIDRALGVLLADKNIKKADVIAKSGLEVHYAYQIFSGAKIPTRDKVIMLCFGFPLSPDETQKLLKITGYAQLYGKDMRDNAILFGLTKGLSIVEVNGMLYELGFSLLT